MKKTLLLLMTCVLGLQFCLAQHNNSEIPTSINEDGTAPHASAILDVQSTTQGVLVPRMTSDQRGMIASPATGLLVFDTDTGGFWFYDGTGWADLSAGGPDGDADPTNELQDLSLSGNMLTITNNGSAATIDLSPYLDDTDTDTQLTETEVDAYVGNNGYITSPDDGDTDPANEYNTGITLNGTMLETTDGGGTISTDLSGLQDVDWLKTDGTQPGLISDAIYTNGNVGIGTPSPSHALDVVGNARVDGSTFFVDATNKRVGIGTSTPDAALHVTGSPALGQIMVTPNSTLGGNDAEIFFGETPDYDFGVSVFYDGGVNRMYFNSISGGIVSSAPPMMTLDRSGEVGIGIINPDAKLHIAGDIKIADGTQGTGKVLTSDADGLASWQDAASGLPSGGTEGQVLTIVGGVPVWSTPPAALAIGDNHAGGIIFYLDASGEHGLVAAPSDQSSGAEWGCVGNFMGALDYGVSHNGSSGGKQNTVRIEAGCPITGTAADLCANLELSTYDDWYLPSLGELDLMYVNLHLNGFGGFGGFVSSWYWSSSEFDDSYAWEQNFNDGEQFSGLKDFNYLNVRAVRAF